MKQIQSVRVTFDLKGTYKETKYADGSIKVEPISSEQGSLIHAEQGGY